MALSELGHLIKVYKKQNRLCLNKIITNKNHTNDYQWYNSQSVVTLLKSTNYYKKGVVLWSPMGQISSQFQMKEMWASRINRSAFINEYKTISKNIL